MDTSQKAKEFIKNCAKTGKLFEIYANNKEYKEFSIPATFFMAGSPGAGKTEVSKSFVKYHYQRNFPIVRIDADDIRGICPGYNGNNSYLFQEATSLGVNKIYDFVLKNKFNCLIDSTFSSFKYAEENIKRALKRKREVYVFYIYQEPMLAWDFAQKREKIEKRKITLDVFVADFLKAKENTNKIKEIFKDKIKINLIKKDYYNQIEKFWINVDNIDNYIEFEYTEEKLYNILNKKI